LVLQLIKYPHPTLRHKSKPLCRVDAELRAMIHEMFDVMYAHEGIGLAANQVDLPYRLLVINTQGKAEAKEQEYVLLNPVIQQQKGSEEKEEGCLSFPGIFAPVKRSQKIVVNAYDLDGGEIRWELNGLLARAVQHECDHLDGRLFIDRISETSLLKIKHDLEDLTIAFHADRDRGLIPSDDAIAARLRDLESART
jgi:peptide deformylase